MVAVSLLLRVPFSPIDLNPAIHRILLSAGDVHALHDGDLDMHAGTSFQEKVMTRLYDAKVQRTTLLLKRRICAEQRACMRSVQSYVDKVIHLFVYVNHVRNWKRQHDLSCDKGPSAAKTEEVSRNSPASFEALQSNTRNLRRRQKTSPDPIDDGVYERQREKDREEATKHRKESEKKQRNQLYSRKIDTLHACKTIYTEIKKEKEEYCNQIVK